MRYSQELRAYTMATAFSLIATLCLVHLLRDDRRTLIWSVLWGLAAAASFLTHYLSAYVLAAHFAYALVQGRRMRLAIAVAGITAAAPVACWLLGPGGQGLQNMAARQTVYAARSTAARPSENFALPSTSRNIVAGWLQSLMALSGIRLQVTGSRLGTLAPLLVVPLLLVVHGLRLLYGKRPREALLLLVISLAGPLAATVLAKRAGHIIPFQALYMNFGVPYVAILMAAGMSAVRDARGHLSWSRISATCGLLLLFAMSALFVYTDAPWHRTGNAYRAAAHQVTQSFLPGDEVRYSSWPIARLVNLYLAPSDPVVQAVEASDMWNGVLLRRHGQVQWTIHLPIHGPPL